MKNPFEQPTSNKEKISRYLAEALPASEPRIVQPMDPSCEVTVVIPSFGRKALFRPLQSLLRQKDITNDQFEVLMVVNNDDASPQWAREQNQEVIKVFSKIKGEPVDITLTKEEEKIVSEIQSSSMRLYVIDKAGEEHRLPSGKANVGGARNRGVAEAVERFSSIEKNGLIVQTDADTALADNYLTTALSFFKQNTNIVGVSGYLDLEREQGNVEMENVYAFADLVKLYESILDVVWARDPAKAKALRFTGANMVSRAFETAYAGGVQEIGQKEDTGFKERLDGVGRTQRLPNLIARPLDRISPRVEGTKGHGRGRERMAEDIKTIGEVTVGEDHLPLSQAVEKLVNSVCQDTVIKERYESALKQIGSEADDKLATIKRKLEVLQNAIRQSPPSVG